MSDLWKYAPQWSKVSGSTKSDQYGVYQGRNSSIGSRYSSTGGFDTTGALWIFGGYGYADSRKLFFPF